MNLLARLQGWPKIAIERCRRRNTRVGVKYGNILITKERDADISLHVMKLIDVTSLTT
jgi:hypothetical protein